MSVITVCKSIITHDNHERKVLQTLRRFPLPVLNLLADKKFSVEYVGHGARELEVLAEVGKNLAMMGDLDGAANSVPGFANGVTTIWDGTAYIYKASPGVISHEVCHLIDLALSPNGLAPIDETAFRAWKGCWTKIHAQEIINAFNQARENNAPFSGYFRTSAHVSEVGAEILRMYFDIQEYIPTPSPGHLFPDLSSYNLVWGGEEPGKDLLKHYCPIGYELVEHSLKEAQLL